MHLWQFDYRTQINLQNFQVFIAFLMHENKKLKKKIFVFPSIAIHSVGKDVQLMHFSVEYKKKIIIINKKSVRACVGSYYIQNKIALPIFLRAVVVPFASLTSRLSYATKLEHFLLFFFLYANVKYTRFISHRELRPRENIKKKKK